MTTAQKIKDNVVRLKNRKDLAEFHGLCDESGARESPMETIISKKQEII